jgi:tripeptide aminopeptidase
MATDVAAAVGRLMQFLAVRGPTGEEAKIAKEVQLALKAAGVAPKYVRFDDANARIPLPTQTGNLIVQLHGTGTRKAERPLLFMAHLDTVPLCAGAAPRISGRKVVNDAPTALGGDNRTGCAVLVSLAAELIARKPDHPPLTLLFTVREESGLFGARHLDPADLGGVGMGFNFDGKQARDAIVGAVGADRWEVEIRGKAAHAGVAPQKGVSATMVVALALAEVHANGYFGKVVKDGREGTSNVGSVGGPDGRAAGDATNVVTDYAHVRGESRSHDPKFVREISAAYKAAFTNAAARVTDDQGKPAKVEFTLRPDYAPFRLKDNSPVVQRAVAAVRSLGLEPNLRVTNGGLDANWMAKHGIPTVTFGAGQHDIHTVNEWIDLNEFEAAVELAYALATG